MTDACFDSEPVPDQPGWVSWNLKDTTRYNAFLGPLMARDEGVVDGRRRARVRMQPERRHSNLQDVMHGGALLGFIDVALFAAGHLFGMLAGPALTLDLSTQFVAGAALDEALEAEVELVRETGRLAFMRGLLVQGDRVVCAWSGTIRKAAIRT